MPGDATKTVVLHRNQRLRQVYLDVPSVLINSPTSRQSDEHQEINIRSTTLANFRDAALKWKDTPFLSFRSGLSCTAKNQIPIYQAVTYTEASQMVDRLAAALRYVGLSYQKKVGLLGDTSPLMLMSDLAITSLGGISVSIPSFLSYDNILYAINHSGIRVLLTQAQFVPMILGISNHCPLLRLVLTFDQVLDDIDLLPRAVKVYAQLSGNQHLLHDAEEDEENSLSENVIDRSYLENIADRSNIAVEAVLESTKEYEDEQKQVKEGSIMEVNGCFKEDDTLDEEELDSQRVSVLAAHFNNVNPLNPVALKIPENKMTDELAKQIIIRAQMTDIQSRFTTPLTALKLSQIYQKKNYGQILSKDLYNLVYNLRTKECSLDNAKNCINSPLYLHHLDNLNIIQLDQLLELTRRDSYCTSDDYPLDPADVWSISYSEVSYTSKYSSIDYLFGTCNRQLWDPHQSSDNEKMDSRPAKKFSQFSLLLSGHPIKANVYSHSCFLAAIRSHFYHHFPYNTAMFSKTHSSYYCHLPYNSLFERIMEHGAIPRGYRLVFHTGQFRYLFSDMLLGKPTIFAASPRFFKKLHQYLVEFLTKVSANKKKLFEKTYNARLTKLNSIYAAIEKAHSLVYMLDTIEYFEEKFIDIHTRNVEAVMQATDDELPQNLQRSAYTLASTHKTVVDMTPNYKNKSKHSRAQSYNDVDYYKQSQVGALHFEKKHALDQLGVEIAPQLSFKNQPFTDIVEPWIISSNPRTRALHTFKIASEDIAIGDTGCDFSRLARLRKIGSKDISMSVMQIDSVNGGGQTDEEKKFDRYMQSIVNKVSAPLSATIKEFIPPEDSIKVSRSKTKLNTTSIPLLPRNILMCSDESDADSNSGISESSARPVTSVVLPSESLVERSKQNIQVMAEGSPFKMQRYGSSYEWQYYDHTKNKEQSFGTGDTESSRSETGTSHSVGVSSKHESEGITTTELSYTITSASHSKPDAEITHAGTQLTELRKKTRSSHSEAMSVIHLNDPALLKEASVHREGDAKQASLKQKKELNKLQRQQQKNMSKVVKDKTTVTKELSRLHFEDNLKVALKSSSAESPVIKRVQDLFGGSLEFIISNSVIDNVDTWEFLRTILGCHGCQLVGYSELTGGGLYNEVHDSSLTWSLGRSGVGVKCKIVDLSEGWFPDILTRLILDSVTPSLHTVSRKLYIQRYNKLQERIANAMPRFIDTQLGELCLAGRMLSLGYYVGDTLYQYAKTFKPPSSQDVLPSSTMESFSTTANISMSEGGPADFPCRSSEANAVFPGQLLSRCSSENKISQKEESDRSSQPSVADFVSANSTPSWLDTDMDTGTFMSSQDKLLKQAARRKSMSIARKNAAALGLNALNLKQAATLETDPFNGTSYTIGVIAGHSASQTIMGVPFINLLSPSSPPASSKTTPARRTSSTSTNSTLAADIAAANQSFVPTMMTPATTNPFSAPLNYNQTTYSSNTSLNIKSYKSTAKDSEHIDQSLAVKPQLPLHGKPPAALSVPTLESHTSSMLPLASVHGMSDRHSLCTRSISPQASLIDPPVSYCTSGQIANDISIDTSSQQGLVMLAQPQQSIYECIIDPTDEDGYYHTGDMVEFEQLSGRIIYRGTVRDYLDRHVYPIIERFLIEEGLILPEQGERAISSLSPALVSSEELSLYSRPSKVPTDMWAKGKLIAMQMRQQLCANLHLTFKLSSSHYLNIGLIEELIMLELPYVIDVLLYTFDGASRPMAFLYIKGAALLEALEQGGIRLNAVESGEADFSVDKFTNSKTIIYATLGKMHGETKDKLMNFLKGPSKGSQLSKHVMRVSHCAFLSVIDNARILTYIRSDIRMVLRDRNLSRYFAPMYIVYATNSDMLLTESKLRTVTGKRNRESFLKKFSGDIARYKQDEGVPELILH